MKTPSTSLAAAGCRMMRVILLHVSWSGAEWTMACELSPGALVLESVPGALILESVPLALILELVP